MKSFLFSIGCVLIMSSCSQTTLNESASLQSENNNTLPSLNNTLMTSQTNNVQTTAPQQGDLIATIKTSKGDMRFKLFPEHTPKTVENFTTHAKNGYYNGIIFHRVIQDFMIQTGDPLGNGTGGESIWGHSFEDEFSPDLKNIKGALSMANRGRNTNGSQFFIVHAEKTEWLDGGHTVFGQIIDGMDVLEAIATTTTGANDKPLETITMNEITISTY